MVLGRIRDMVPKRAEKSEEPTEEYLEITEEHTRSDNKVGVKIESLESYDDTEKVQEQLRHGNIVFLKIKDLRAKDISELKKSVDKLRKTCTAMDGDIVGVEDEYLVITPNFAQIYRGRTA